ncbi:hypothetical protein CDAR_586841 [Caerostris darwini]|uniref:Uncharacterized protein n=1 Tax=Caerostris darwini TaxID=1538125 RepID=A0AAV4SYI4_9ARAC|nr:hypothetical protein CDAR_586841 [Caerostris darwini]
MNFSPNLCEENWVDVTNERLENTFLIPVCLSRPSSQQTIEYRLLRPTPPEATEGKGPSAPVRRVGDLFRVSTNTDVSNRPRLNKWTD